MNFCITDLDEGQYNSTMLWRVSVGTDNGHEQMKAVNPPTGRGRSIGDGRGMPAPQAGLPGPYTGYLFMSIIGSVTN
ncbi:MAG TPA: hypothetical protein VGN15_10120 [Ktedonobacteraceae bacterium]|nr:hypothetical protein [Ktedonobacteraceae bacterium]